MNLSMNTSFSGFTNTASKLSADVNLAMTRLSTGKKLNTSGDSVVQIGQIQTARAQVTGIAAAVGSVSSAINMF